MASVLVLLMYFLRSGGLFQKSFVNAVVTSSNVLDLSSDGIFPVSGP